MFMTMHTQLSLIENTLTLKRIPLFNFIVKRRNLEFSASTTSGKIWIGRWSSRRCCTTEAGPGCILRWSPRSIPSWSTAGYEAGAAASTAEANFEKFYIVSNSSDIVGQCVPRRPGPTIQPRAFQLIFKVAQSLRKRRVFRQVLNWLVSLFPSE